MKIRIETEAELPQAARQLIEAAGDKRLWAFYAPMGAGKTTLIAALCRELGVEADMVASPTFSIINEYVAADGAPVYHFDFYRVESEEEAADTGAEFYFDSDAYCFVEWPEMAGRLIPEDALQVTIEVDPSTGVRTITLS